VAFQALSRDQRPFFLPTAVGCRLCHGGKGLYQQPGSLFLIGEIQPKIEIKIWKFENEVILEVFIHQM
jgi:hypothetical protein